MPFSAEEKARIRAHLGYLNVQPAASVSYGIPKPIQTMFLLEVAMENILPTGEDRVRFILQTMDRIECLLVEAQERLAAIQLGDLQLRENEPDMLEKEYFRWGGRLADQLGVPFYAYSNRYKQFAAASAGSIPVYNS